MLGRGSEWRRWEPHIHAPGTVLNNQFSGTNAWNDYLTALEAATPQIEAIAVTDYYVTDTYEEVLRRRREEGRLPNVQLVFPNIELRLHVAAKSGFVNMHLLVSPEDDDHVARIQRFLARLEFRAFDDRFDCTRSELIRLGRRDKGAQLEERAALEHGATQFKVSFDQLRTVWDEDAWARANVLIAVAGGSGDGTAGVREAADQVTRQEIERFAGNQRFGRCVSLACRYTLLGKAGKTCRIGIHIADDVEGRVDRLEDIAQIAEPETEPDDPNFHDCLRSRFS